MKKIDTPIMFESDGEYVTVRTDVKNDLLVLSVHENYGIASVTMSLDSMERLAEILNEKILEIRRIKS